MSIIDLEQYCIRAHLFDVKDVSRKLSTLTIVNYNEILDDLGEFEPARDHIEEYVDFAQETLVNCFDERRIFWYTATTAQYNLNDIAQSAYDQRKDIIVIEVAQPCAMSRLNIIRKALLDKLLSE